MVKYQITSNTGDIIMSHPNEYTVNPDNEKDFSKLYEESSDEEVVL